MSEALLKPMSPADAKAHGRISVQMMYAGMASRSRLVSDILFGLGRRSGRRRMTTKLNKKRQSW